MEYGLKNQARHKTLYEVFFSYRNILTDIVMVVLSVAVMAALANIEVPLWPVPLTMQTFGVFLIAFFFGSRKGVISILLYLAAGLIGFGVFAGYSSGSRYFLGPTAGYLIGFILMAFVVGLLVEKGYGRTKKSVLYCMILGEAILYIFGLTGLYVYLGDVSLWQVLQYGFIPFIIGDIIKIGIAIQLYPYIFKKGREIESKAYGL